MNDSSSRTVITGIGIFSPIGIGVDAVWSSLSAMKSGIGQTTVMEGTSFAIGGEVPGFDPKTVKKSYLAAQKKNVKVMCRDIQLGVASALQAMDHANLTEDESIARERIGVDFGANLMLSPPDILARPAQSCASDESTFQFDEWGGHGLGQMFPLWLLMYLPNMPACHIAITVDARGPSNSLTLDDASGGVAIAEASRILSRGQADVMISGSTGTRVHPVKSMHAELWDDIVKQHDDPPETWSRPFSSDRLGRALGEGSCTFILEDADHARGRSAVEYGTILGTGSSCVVSKDIKPNQKQALVNAMKAALSDAGLTTDDIGHINADGSATESGDRAEAEAIHEVFGTRGPEVPVTAIKSYLGDSGSGNGPLELGCSLIALKEGVIPATLNVSNPDPACNLNIVRGEHQPTDNRVVMSVNVTRMGQATAIIVDAS